jgi:hypothetical protein
MSRKELMAAIELACMPNASYRMEVLAKYIQASYGLTDMVEVKTAILTLINSGVLVLNNDFELARKVNQSTEEK